MKKIYASFAILFLVVGMIEALPQTKPDELLFQDAKLLLFDKKWEKAEEKLNELLQKYPESSLFPQVLFYKGKCLQEQRNREKQALEAYRKYLQLKDKNLSLIEEVEISVIDLAFRMYERGEASYLGEIEQKLASSNKVIRYYAAFKLSYAKDNKAAVKGVPVLKDIVRKERDAELKDRAKIALLRVDPDALKNFVEKETPQSSRVLKIRVYEKNRKDVKLSINIPWALADLALQAIPEEERRQMRKEGYDIDKLMKELMRFNGKIIEIEGEDSLIKIWID